MAGNAAAPAPMSREAARDMAPAAVHDAFMQFMETQRVALATALGSHEQARQAWAKQLGERDSEILRLRGELDERGKELEQLRSAQVSASSAAASPAARSPQLAALRAAPLPELLAQCAGMMPNTPGDVSIATLRAQSAPLELCLERVRDVVRGPYEQWGQETAQEGRISALQEHFLALATKRAGVSEGLQLSTDWAERMRAAVQRAHGQLREAIEALRGMSCNVDPLLVELHVALTHNLRDLAHNEKALEDTGQLALAVQQDLCEALVAWQGQVEQLRNANAAETSALRTQTQNLLLRGLPVWAATYDNGQRGLRISGIKRRSEAEEAAGSAGGGLAGQRGGRPPSGASTPDSRRRGGGGSGGSTPAQRRSA